MSLGTEIATGICDGSFSSVTPFCCSTEGKSRQFYRSVVILVLKLVILYHKSLDSQPIFYLQKPIMDRIGQPHTSPAKVCFHYILEVLQFILEIRMAMEMC